MGRYDVLTELEEKPLVREQVPKPESTQTVKPTSTLVHKTTKPQVDKPTNGLIKKPHSETLPSPANEKPQKYTTHLTSIMVKQIKIFAVQQDIKDYEVVEKALAEYFERNK